jgi:branched-chain amino acid aminotransferase
MAGEFGTVFMPEMVLARYDNGWSAPEFVSSDALTVHPGAHVLHYASACFEGLKAFRQQDNSIALFRAESNVARFAQSSDLLALPAIDEAVTLGMIKDIVKRFADDVPEAPASMYIRPTHIGTEAAIGKAAAPSDTSLLYVILSPVGDYFASGEASLRLLLDTEGVRCGADHGMVKGGGNYASALKHIMRAHAEHNADQVLFCPDGLAQETGAANFILVEGGELVTKPLDESFLHGVTRDSILQLARDNGLTVSERELPVDELIDRVSKPDAEAGLTGTAAVLAAVGTLIHEGREYPVGKGKPGPILRQLRDQLNAIQWGTAPDVHGWTSRLV